MLHSKTRANINDGELPAPFEITALGVVASTGYRGARRAKRQRVANDPTPAEGERPKPLAPSRALPIFENDLVLGCVP